MARSQLRDPYRRFTWGKALFAAVAPLLLGLPFALVSPVGQAGGGPFVRALWLLAGLCTWWAAAISVAWWPPSPRAREAGTTRNVEFSTARRLLYVALALPSGALFAEPDHVAVGLSISGVLASFAWLASGVRIGFDGSGVERAGGLHRHLRLSWGEIHLAQVFPAGVVLHRADGKSILVNCRQVDGYPELAAAILRHLPADTSGLEAGRTILEAQAASAPAGPA